MEPGLKQLEHEVEAARGKLAHDLATLRSPATTAEFTETLKQEAIEAKDALVDKARSTVQSSVESLLQDLKGRAAANPAAALAIGAGLAWRLIRHPPIATALIGAGLLSLFRTAPAHTNGHAPADYLSHAKSRLMEQASAAVDAVHESGSAAAQAAAEKATQTASAVKEKVEGLTAQASAGARDLADEARARSSTMWREGRDTIQEGLRSAASSARSAQSAMSTGVEQSWPTGGDSDTRNTFLLGAASVAVIAALGIALQRRGAENADSA